MIKKYEDLICWQKARILVNKIYEITSSPGYKTDYTLIKQIRRAAISIMLNISEGFSRNSNKQFSYFLYVARGSAAEVQSCLYISKDLNYISEGKFRELYDLSNEISKIISGLLRKISE